MKDYTLTYMLIIVGIVAVVGILVMMIQTPVTTAPVSTTGITGNVIVGDNTGDVNIFGKLLATAALLGVAGYMYLKKD